MKITATQTAARPNKFRNFDDEPVLPATAAGTYTLTVKLTAADLDSLQVHLNEYADPEKLTARTVAQFLRDTLRCQLEEDAGGRGML